MWVAASRGEPIGLGIGRASLLIRSSTRWGLGLRIRMATSAFTAGRRARGPSNSTGSPLTGLLSRREHGRGAQADPLRQRRHQQTLGVLGPDPEGDGADGVPAELVLAADLPRQ